MKVMARGRESSVQRTDRTHPGYRPESATPSLASNFTSLYDTVLLPVTRRHITMVHTDDRSFRTFLPATSHVYVAQTLTYIMTQWHLKCFYCLDGYSLMLDIIYVLSTIMSVQPINFHVTTIFYFYFHS